MARILYISPEHVSGALELFQRGHQQRGHECRYATFFPSSSGFKEDICLNLPLMPDAGWLAKLKGVAYRSSQIMQGKADRPGCPPTWRPNTAAEAVFFFLRDQLLRLWIEPAIRRHRFAEYDVYHLDQGLDFYRNAHFVRKMKARGAKIVCFYHGTDLRNRGVIPAVDALSDLNLTSELDLLFKHPNMRYLHLPFAVENYQARGVENDPLIIGTACRSPEARHFKGIDRVIEVVKQLERSFPVKLDLVEGLPNEECLRRKSRWDIAVDQIADLGGWGYGMNSLESLALGIPTCTRMNEQCQSFFHDHPFINVDENSLATELIRLIEDRDWRRRKGLEGRTYVEKRHALSSVMAELYRHYQQAGINLR